MFVILRMRPLFQVLLIQSSVLNLCLKVVTILILNGFIDGLEGVISLC